MSRTTRINNLRAEAERCLSIARETDSAAVLLDIIALEGWLNGCRVRIKTVVRAVLHIRAYA